MKLFCVFKNSKAAVPTPDEVGESFNPPKSVCHDSSEDDNCSLAILNSRTSVCSPGTVEVCATFAFGAWKPKSTMGSLVERW